MFLYQAAETFPWPVPLLWMFWVLGKICSPCLSSAVHVEPDPCSITKFSHSWHCYCIYNKSTNCFGLLTTSTIITNTQSNCHINSSILPSPPLRTAQWTEKWSQHSSAKKHSSTNVHLGLASIVSQFPPIDVNMPNFTAEIYMVTASVGNWRCVHTMCHFQ